MASWLDTYLSSLRLRDAREKRDAAVIDAYTALADRHAALEKERYTTAAVAADSKPLEATAPPPTSLAIPPSIVSWATRGSSSPPPPQPIESADVSRLRSDLATSHRAYATLEKESKALQGQLDSLQEVAAQHDAEATKLKERIGKLERDKEVLRRKGRDLESELKEKQRLVREVQDEIATMEMQVTVAEERAKKVEEEYRVLLDRYMRRVGREAEELNADLR